MRERIHRVNTATRLNYWKSAILPMQRRKPLIGKGDACMMLIISMGALDVGWRGGVALVGVGILGGVWGWAQAWRFRRRWRAAQLRAWEDVAGKALQTQLWAALEASDRAHQEMETIFNTVQDALVVYGPDGAMLHANAYAKRLFAPMADLTRAEIAAQMQVTLLDGTPVTHDQLPLERILHGEHAPPPGILRLRFPGMAPVSVMAHTAPLWDATGKLIGVLLALRDVTADLRHTRNNDIMRAIARACANAAEEATVAEAALHELLRGLGSVGGVISVRDRVRPGYARCLAARLDAVLPSANQAFWHQHMALTPIGPDAPLVGMRVLASGTEFFGTTTVAGTVPADVHVFCVPLRFEGAVFGVLSIGFAPATIADESEIDRELVRAAADEIATSLHRARLYEEARQLALIDPLTGLRNHRAMQDVLRQEMASGTVQGLPVSIIMLDLDHFRKFNETFGHDVGDRALCAVANAIQSQLRHGDVAARYGGEEFIIVLPAMDAARAGTMAMRINAAIAATEVVVDAAGQRVRLTASLGHATFPMHASAPPSLLKAADLALFAAKRAGRNTVVAYTPTMLETSGQFLPGASAFSAHDPSEITLPSGADLETVQALITAIDLRDGYTAAHSEGVSRYAVAIATEMNLPTEYVEVLRLGGLVHDVGKIGVPDQVLRKPGKLDDDEWRQMQAHTTMGEEILRPVEQLHHLLPLVRWHHERLDGSGYPDGLRGDEISLLVRILSVADVFEAFTAERPYHPGRPAIEGLRLLQREAAQGKMDPYIVEVFESLLLCQGLIEEAYAHGEQDMQPIAA
jgi:diguanylate cyclase (GGDEF)-like protein